MVAWRIPRRRRSVSSVDSDLKSGTFSSGIPEPVDSVTDHRESEDLPTLARSLARGFDEHVLVVSRTGCHLCDEAEVIVGEVCAEYSMAWRRIDVDEDASLLGVWSDHVPVVILNGDLVAMWVVDRQLLHDKIAMIEANP